MSKWKIGKSISLALSAALAFTSVVPGNVALAAPSGYKVSFAFLDSENRDLGYSIDDIAMTDPVGVAPTYTDTDSLDTPPIKKSLLTGLYALAALPTAEEAGATWNGSDDIFTLSEGAFTLDNANLNAPDMMAADLYAATFTLSVEYDNDATYFVKGTDGGDPAHDTYTETAIANSDAWTAAEPLYEGIVSDTATLAGDLYDGAHYFTRTGSEGAYVYTDDAPEYELGSSIQGKYIDPFRAVSAIDTEAYYTSTDTDLYFSKSTDPVDTYTNITSTLNPTGATVTANTYYEITSGTYPDCEYGLTNDTELLEGTDYYVITDPGTPGVANSDATRTIPNVPDVPDGKVGSWTVTASAGTITDNYSISGNTLTIDGDYLDSVYGGNVTITLKATYTDKPYLGLKTDSNYKSNDSGNKTANVAEFNYGKEVIAIAGTSDKEYVFTAFKDVDRDGTFDVGEEADYGNVTWSIWRYKDTTLADGVIDADSNLIDAADYLADYGLSTTADDEDFTLALNPGAKKAMAESTFVIKLTDKATSDKLDAKKFRIKIKINPIAVVATPNDIATLPFTNANMGYTVKAWDADVSGLTAGTYTQAKRVIISTSTANIQSGYGVDTDHRTIKIIDRDNTDGKDGTKAFKILSESTEKLFSNSNVNVIVAPESNLEAGTYKASLSIETDATIEPVLVPLEFTVGNNLKITKVIGHGGEEVDLYDKVDGVTAGNFAIKAAATSDHKLYQKTSAGYVEIASYDPYVKVYYEKVNYYNLGTLHVGEQFSDIVITAEGGVGTVSFDNDLTTDNGLGNFGFDNTGILGHQNKSTDIATFNLRGKVLNTKTGTITFYAYVRDSSTPVYYAENNKRYEFRIKVVDYDLEYAVDGEEVEYGDDGTGADNLITWNVPKDYTATDEIRTVSIKNNSDDAITLTPSWSVANKFTCSETAAFTIAAGSTKTLTITPKAGLNSATSILTLTGSGDTASGVTTTGIKFDMVINTYDVEITTPSDSGTGYDASAAAIEPAVIGEQYSYKFETTKSASVQSVSWKIDEVKDGASAAVNTAAEMDVVLKKYGFSFNGTTATLSGVPKQAATSLQMKVTASYTDPTTNLATSVSKYVKLAIAPGDEGFTFTSAGDEIDDDEKALNLGNIPKDKLDTIVAGVNIKNNLKLDMTAITSGADAGKSDVKLSIVQIDSNTSLSGNEFAIILDPDNAILNKDLVDNGFDLKALADKDFTIKYKSGSYAVGEHFIIVKAEHTGVAPKKFCDDQYFKIKFTVKDAPIINKTAVDATSFVANKEVKDTDNAKYTVTYATDVSAEFEYAWTGAPTGLELSKKGVITGKPEKSGTYKVTVTATNKKDDTIVGTLTHELIVAGASTITVTTNLSSNGVAADNTSADPTGKFILLPGTVVGDKQAEKQAFHMEVTRENAKQVRVTVEDADDDRSAAEIRKNAKNPYEGSSNYINVDNSSWSVIEKGTSQNFRIISKGSPAPGVYKVKITITADNANEIEFYAIMAVVDKLTLVQPNTENTMIGTTYNKAPTAGTDEKKLVLSATGAAKVQKITWAESGTEVVDGTKKETQYYITKDGDEATISDITGLNLLAASYDIGEDEDGEGLKTYVENTLKVSGEYSVKLKASVTGKDVDLTLAKDYDDISAAIKRSAPTKTALGSSEGDFTRAKATVVIPKQEAEAVTFNIVSGKTDKVEVIKVTDTAADAKATRGKVLGERTGDVMVTRTGYTYNPVTATYNKTDLETTITVKNTTNLNLKKMTAALSENSKFEIKSGGTTTFGGGAEEDIVIRPKEKLTEGTYTDKLVISGDNFKTIEFALTFTVEAPAYKVTVDDNASDTTKRVVYLKDNETTGKTVEIANFVADTTAKYADLTIRNTGNAQISGLLAYEVDANGEEYASGSLDRMLTVSPAATTLAVGASTEIRVTARKTSVGSYSSYVNIHFTEGTGTSAVERNYKIPVSYLVYGKNLESLTIAPSDEVKLTLTEGYSTAQATVNFTATNTGANETSDIIALSESVSGSSFEVLTKAANLKAGNSATYSVRLKAGMPEGEYTTNVTFAGTNLKSSNAFVRTITVVVKAADTFNVDATSYEEDIPDSADHKFAIALYNTLVKGIMGGPAGTGLISNGKVVEKYATDTDSTHFAVKVDVDKNKSADVEVIFEVDDSTDIASVTGATIQILGTNSISTASKTLALTTDQVDDAKEGFGYVAETTTTPAVYAKCFTAIKVNFFAEVVIGSYDSEATPGTPDGDGTLFAEKKDDIDNDYVTAQLAVPTGAYKGNAIGAITALVPYDNEIGSVFTAGKLPTAIQELPTYHKATNVQIGWVYTLGSTGLASASDVVYGDVSIGAKWHTHKYAASTETDETKVKWVWTKDDEGNRTAELHLFCTDKNCPDHAGSEIIVNGKSKVDGVVIQDADNDTTGNQPLKYSKRTSKDADCEHGAHYEYPVQAKVLGVVYEGKDIEDEVGEPLGHKFDLSVDPTITWTDANSDGLMTKDEVKVTRICSRCGETVELTVVDVLEKNKVEPTCTKDGSVQYAIVYTEFTEDGKAGSNAEKNYKEVTLLKAKGHAEVLEAVVEDFNEETLIAKKLTLTCPDCGEVVFEKTNVKFTEAADGTFTYKALIEATGKYYDVSYTNHAHIWEGAWTWSDDLTEATLTITCKQGAKPEVKKFTVTPTVTNKGAVYTYAVEYTYTWTEKGEAKTKTFTDSKQLVKSEEGQVIEDIIPIAEDLGIYIEGLEEEYFYTGAPIKPSFSVIDASTGLVYLVPGVDYTVSYKNNKKLGDTATITVKGKGNYEGKSAVATFKILDPKTGVSEDDLMDLKGFKVSVPKDVVLTYNGEAQMPAKIVVKKGKAATTYTWDSTGYVDEKGEALDAVVTVSNNIDAGTAKLLLTGKNNDKGTATTAGTTFKIAPAPLAGDGVALTIDPTKLQWAAKGARPAVTVTWNGQELLEGRDFTVTYKKNTKIGASASVVVKGKGNFDKKTELSKGFEVEAFDLASAEIIAATGVAAGKAAKSVKVTVIDANGDVIPASKLAVVVKADDTVVTGKLVEKTEYTIVATPKSAKVAEVTGETPAFTVTAGADFGKAKVTVAKEFYKTYTGEAIELEEEDLKYITVTIGPKKTAKTLVCGEDFTIAGYTNNIKKGKMTITLKGIDEAGYTGAKTFTVKIKAKQLVK